MTYPRQPRPARSRETYPAGPLDGRNRLPYLSPVPWRGKPNEPALVAFTAETVALERGMDPAELWTLCGDNTRHFFNAPAKGL